MQLYTWILVLYCFSAVFNNCLATVSTDQQLQRTAQQLNQEQDRMTQLSERLVQLQNKPEFVDNKTILNNLNVQIIRLEKELQELTTRSHSLSTTNGIPPAESSKDREIVAKRQQEATERLDKLNTKAITLELEIRKLENGEANKKEISDLAFQDLSLVTTYDKVLAEVGQNEMLRNQIVEQMSEERNNLNEKERLLNEKNKAKKQQYTNYLNTSNLLNKSKGKSEKAHKKWIELMGNKAHNYRKKLLLKQKINKETDQVRKEQLEKELEAYEQVANDEVIQSLINSTIEEIETYDVEIATCEMEIKNFEDIKQEIVLVEKEIKNSNEIIKQLEEQKNQLQKEIEPYEALKEYVDKRRELENTRIEYEFLNQQKEELKKIQIFIKEKKEIESEIERTVEQLQNANIEAKEIERKQQVFHDEIEAIQVERQQVVELVEELQLEVEKLTKIEEALELKANESDSNESSTENISIPDCDSTNNTAAKSESFLNISVQHTLQSDGSFQVIDSNYSNSPSIAPQTTGKAETKRRSSINQSASSVSQHKGQATSGPLNSTSIGDNSLISEITTINSSTKASANKVTVKNGRTLKAPTKPSNLFAKQSKWGLSRPGIFAYNESGNRRSFLGLISARKGKKRHHQDISTVTNNKTQTQNLKNNLNENDTGTAINTGTANNINASNGGNNGNNNGNGNDIGNGNSNSNGNNNNGNNNGNINNNGNDNNNDELQHDDIQNKDQLEMNQEEIGNEDYQVPVKQKRMNPPIDTCNVEKEESKMDDPVVEQVPINSAKSNEESTQTNNKEPEQVEVPIEPIPIVEQPKPKLLRMRSLFKGTKSTTNTGDKNPKKSKKLFWILGSIITVVVVGIVTYYKVFLKKMKKEIKDEEVSKEIQ